LSLMTANLRKYQVFGAQYVVCQQRVLLGDDMGLGKTIQVLAAMCHLAAQGKRHFFVVAPNSVLVNWEREVKKHTKLSPIIVHGFDRDDELQQWQRDGGVAITTYTTLARLADKITLVDLLEWTKPMRSRIRPPSGRRRSVSYARSQGRWPSCPAQPWRTA
jgi:SNF2 family DNA or RNA helicase